MPLLPLTDGCLLLGIDPKTLRLWLKAARLSPTVHPSDARLKCLTQPQLHHLATLHARLLPESLPNTVSTASPRLSSALCAPVPAEAAPPVARACTPSADTDLRHTLAHLQTQLATLQEQVTQLALALLRERQWRWEERAVHPQAPLPPSSPPTTTPAPTTPAADPARSPPRSRSRALPLIE